jgi:hypothetical protein
MPDSLSGSRTQPSYAVASSTVTDNVTHLVWQRVLPATYDGCTGNSDPSGVVGANCTLAEANQYCDSVMVSMMLGGSGWRLPTKIELESIVDETRKYPATDTLAFPNTAASGFWTATPYRGQADSTWVVDFEVGYSLRNVDKFERVRCVR